MTSLMENNKTLYEINFFLLNDQISEENLEKFKSCCEQYGRSLSILETNEILRKLKDDFRVSPFKGTYTTYFKLFALKSIPLTTDRILQLDGDTVINGSLEPLCDIDLSDCVFAASYDCTMNQYKALIDIPITDKFYNGGVLLVNQSEWIKDDCEQQIANHLKNVRSGYYTVDQDILNVLFRKKIKYLDLKYNFNSGFYVYGIKESFRIYNLKPEYYNTYEEVAEAYKDPVIYHCMGAMTGRPWETNSIHPQNDIYDKYLAMSPWKDCEKVSVNRAEIFKIQRFLYRVLPRRIYTYFHRYAQKRYLEKMNEVVQRWD